MRPLKIATCIVAGGCLAALPFYRSASNDSEELHQRLDTGPGTEAVDWGFGLRVRTQPAEPDPMSGWQPTPMVMPQPAVVEQPRMPNSYYDTVIPWEEPDPIRERFSAAAMPSPTAADNQRVESFQNWAASSRASYDPVDPTEGMIEDRFVFTPIEPLDPFPALAKPSNREGQPPATPKDGTPIQNASLGRVLPAAPDAAPRQRHFIREPD